MKSISLQDVKDVIQAKGYKLMQGGRPNIVGIRNTEMSSDEFIDRCFVWWVDEGTEEVHDYTITTRPGFHYLKNPMNKNGTAILVPGQYIGSWILGMHLGKQFALCQRGGPVKVYRDNNKDSSIDLNTAKIEEGYFGIDLHHAGINDADVIGPYSAGCQVWRYHEPHEWLMDRFKELGKKYEFTKFSYTLLKQEEFT